MWFLCYFYGKSLSLTFYTLIKSWYINIEIFASIVNLYINFYSFIMPKLPVHTQYHLLFTCGDLIRSQLMDLKTMWKSTMVKLLGSYGELIQVFNVWTNFSTYVVEFYQTKSELEMLKIVDSFFISQTICFPLKAFTSRIIFFTKSIYTSTL